MRIKSVGLEGQTEGTISDAGLGEFSEVTFGGAFGDGQSGGGNTGGELSSPSGDNSGRNNSSNGDPETPRKKRGRPAGSTNANANAKSGTKLVGERLADARRKFISTLAGGIGFGFSAYGVFRGKKYQEFSPELAQNVYACYLVPPSAAESVAEPIADTFIQHFPQFVEPVEKSINPALAIARIISLLQQTSDNEKMVVQKFQQRINAPKPPTNGNHPPEPEQPTESPLDQWMNEQGQTPEGILTHNVPVG